LKMEPRCIIESITEDHSEKHFILRLSFRKPEWLNGIFLAQLII
jgi:hypothetical protein